MVLWLLAGIIAVVRQFPEQCSNVIVDIRCIFVLLFWYVLRAYIRHFTFHNPSTRASNTNMPLIFDCRPKVLYWRWLLLLLLFFFFIHFISMKGSKRKSLHLMHMWNQMIRWFRMKHLPPFFSEYNPFLICHFNFSAFIIIEICKRFFGSHFTNNCEILRNTWIWINDAFTVFLSGV